MKMKMLIATIAVLAMASSSMAATWFYEDFESYASGIEFRVVWPPDNGGLAFFTDGGWDGPKCVGGGKTPRRHARDLVPDIQAAPGGAGMTSVVGTDSEPLIMEVALFLKGDTLPYAQAQAFYWDLDKGGDYPARAPSTTPHSALGFGAYPYYDGGASRAGLMYYDGLNWTELTTLKHALGWNFLRAIIKETTVSFMYWDETMSNGMQTAMVNREYLGDFDTMGISSATCPVRVRATDAYDLDGGVFVPEPTTVLLLGLGGLVSMRSGLRRRRVATNPACGG